MIVAPKHVRRNETAKHPQGNCTRQTVTLMAAERLHPNDHQRLPDFAAKGALVADIVGANGRFAFDDLGTLQLSSSASFCCAEFHRWRQLRAAYSADFLSD